MEALCGLRAPAEAIQRRTQAPPALCAISVMAAASFATSIHHDVEIPRIGVRPLVTAFMAIGRSGERKSTVDHLASLPIRRAEAALAARYDTERHEYDCAKEAFEAARAEQKKRAKHGREAVEGAMLSVGPEPKPPAPPMLTAEEGTVEGLIALLTLRPYAALFSAEGGMFLAGHAMSEDAAVRTMTTLNALWDGAPIKRLRAGKATYAPGRRSSLSLAVQRSVAGILLDSASAHAASAQDNGLLSRLLITWPESTIGTRMWRDDEPEFDQFLDDYNARIGELLTRAPRRLEGSDGLDPTPLPFHIDAERRLKLFHDATEHDQNEGRRYHPITGFGSKMCEHASRLAAIFAAYEGCDFIDAEKFEAGATLATYFAGEHLRLQETAAEDPAIAKAEKLLAWWQSKTDPRAHLAEIYQRGPHCLRNAKQAKATVAILEDSGWITRLAGGAEVDGAPRRDAWELVP